MKKKPSQSDFALTRRQLLTMMGLSSVCYAASNPINMLARCITDGLISDAQAQAGFPAKKLIAIGFPGALANYVPSFIAPNNESIIANASMKNALATDNYNPGNPANAAWRNDLIQVGNGRTVYGSPLWNATLPTTNGAVVYARELLKNLIHFRGVDCLADAGHVRGYAMTLKPLGSNASITGAVADSHAALPLTATGFEAAVNYADEQYGGYLSRNGITPSLIRNPNGGNTLQDLLSPFILTDAGATALSTKFNAQAVKTAMKGAMDELSVYARSQLPGADILYNNRTSAEKLLNGTFGNLGTTWTTLLTKYENLIGACAQKHIPYVLPLTGVNRSGSYSREIAWQAAAAEYLLTADFDGKKGLSSSISLSFQYALNFAGLSIFTDEHEAGDRQMSAMCCSFIYFSLLAIINELTRVLKANNLFQDTVFLIGTEYGRNPRANGSGSDHATGAGYFTAISGAIPDAMGPIIMGNILTDSLTGGSGADYPGTWGLGTTTPSSLGNIRLNVNHVAATTTALLGVPAISNTPPLITMNSSGVVASNLCGPPQNV